VTARTSSELPLGVEAITKLTPSWNRWEETKEIQPRRGEPA